MNMNENKLSGLPFVADDSWQGWTLDELIDAGATYVVKVEQAKKDHEARVRLAQAEWNEQAQAAVLDIFPNAMIDNIEGVNVTNERIEIVVKMERYDAYLILAYANITWWNYDDDSDDDPWIRVDGEDLRLIQWNDGARYLGMSYISPDTYDPNRHIAKNHAVLFDGNYSYRNDFQPIPQYEGTPNLAVELAGFHRICEHKGWYHPA